MAYILETSHLTYGYEEDRQVLQDLTVAFEEGKTTAILGANGAGKSTLFLHLNGILRPDKGEVLFQGKPISYQKAALRQLRSKVGIVFQNPDDQLFSASVYQDISFGAMNMGLEKKEVRKRVEIVMEQLGITSLKEHPTHSLSYGQKKRVSIAGILVMEPEVIILDEPTAGLDSVGVSELMHLLRKVCRQRKTTVILSTHDIDVIPVYADLLYVMDQGKIIAYGTPKEIFSQPEMLRKHHLRLPRLSHLLEIFQKEDALAVDFSAATISGARDQIVQCFTAIQQKRQEEYP